MHQGEKQFTEEFRLEISTALARRGAQHFSNPQDCGSRVELLPTRWEKEVGIQSPFLRKQDLHLLYP